MIIFKSCRYAIQLPLNYIRHGDLPDMAYHQSGVANDYRIKKQENRSCTPVGAG
jgi:hypothetical protein